MQILNKFKADQVISVLNKAGYRFVDTNKQNPRYTKGRNDNVWIAKTYNIVRCNKGTEAERILTEMFGNSNPKYVSESHRDYASAWGFNGYVLREKG